MRTKSIFTLSIISALLFSVSCDRVENPVVNNETALDWNLYPDADTSTYPWPTWTTNANTVRNVLLEDYTGHTCTNCPSAAVIAKNIEDASNGKVIVLSVHASTTGGFQAPELPELPLDHRTEAGDAYATAMNIAGNPLGMVNRKNSSGTYFIFSSNWQTETNTELAKAPDFNIQAQYNYYESTDGLFLHTEVEALNDLNGNYNLINFLSRDTVIAPQKDQGGVFHHHYDHHSVLSDNINGIWGTPVVNGDITSGDKIYNDYSFQLPDPIADTTYRVNNLSIISVVCDRDNYEILQVIKTPLSP